jgi:hypothetical protein
MDGVTSDEQNIFSQIMRANADFRNLDKRFWANVRLIGQIIGYTKVEQVRTYTIDDLLMTMKRIGLNADHLVGENSHPTPFSERLIAYFDCRAHVLNEFVKIKLMDVNRAKALFEDYYTRFSPRVELPENKQKGDKKAPAYLTGLVNMLIEEHLGRLPCDYSPKSLTIFTENHTPLRTLSRRMDSCFPNCIDPIAIWEIKEYYYTTTFGSRIADGVYETLLDGMELEELAGFNQTKIEHILIVDAYSTWWEQGKSYLCRLIDLLHMGYVDELLSGYEVIKRLPEIVQSWRKKYEQFA